MRAAIQFLLAVVASHVASLPVAPAAAADCKVFYTGQCPGDDSCLCTLNEPCSSSSLPCIRNSSTSNCGGACRKVAHGLCPGGASCLADDGECDAPPPPPSYAWGPDVSDYQGTVDWSAVKAAGASFAFTKATEGLTFTCQTFAPNWQGMRDVGIGLRGAYHFGHPGEDPQAQAKYFVDTVGELRAGEVMVLDIEVASSNASLHSAQDVASWSKDFVDAVCSLANVPPSRVFIYTGAWFWNPQTGGSGVCSDHPLWVSGYTSSPPMPGGWSDWTFWQYTDKASIPGISGGVDCSYFHGSSTQFAAWAKRSGGAPA